MAENVKDIDLGWKKIKKEIGLLNKSYTKIGIQSTAGSEDGVTIAMIGLYNEFGTKGIPARPFMRSSFAENKKQVEKIKASQYAKILAGKQTVKRALGLIGEFMVGKVKLKITSLRTPKNADFTIRIKKSSNPLIDTGRMRASIKHVEVLQGKGKELKNE